ncbi:aldo/keto reductase family protein [Alkalibacterium sp. f15]|uniref:aldo/keto reductase family protein n=1 Tax=Alkalibacterium sp. f15 TaxID=3414029 RepID=UPI003BF830BA
MDMVTLYNGKKMPVIGFEICNNSDEEKAVQSIVKAIEVGFRHLDSAAGFQNEKIMSQGLKKSGFPREELFLTSNLMVDGHDYSNVRAKVERLLEILGTDYLDLYLIHWPLDEGTGEDWDKENLETWRVMEELYEEGKLKAIGVSNFSINHLENIVEHAKIKPMVNRLRIHPGVTQNDVREYCKKYDIIVQACSPLNPLNVLRKENRIREMLEKYNKSLAQVLLRFGIDLDVLPLTKSAHAYRIEENYDIFDFKLDEEDYNYLFHWQHVDFTESDNQNGQPPQSV